MGDSLDCEDGACIVGACVIERALGILELSAGIEGGESVGVTVTLRLLLGEAVGIPPVLVEVGQAVGEGEACVEGTGVIGYLLGLASPTLGKTVG